VYSTQCIEWWNLEKDAKHIHKSIHALFFILRHCFMVILHFQMFLQKRIKITNISLQKQFKYMAEKRRQNIHCFNSMAFFCFLSLWQSSQSSKEWHITICQLFLASRMSNNLWCGLDFGYLYNVLLTHLIYHDESTLTEKCFSKFHFYIYKGLVKL
jgi:hypothetical protein